MNNRKPLVFMRKMKMKPWTDLSKGFGVAYPCDVGSRLLSFVGLCLLLASVIALFGCSSTYHGVQSHLPPDPASELNLRLVEAQNAEKQTTQAAARLRDNLKSQPTKETANVDFDRLETAAFEFHRRVLAIQDSARHAPEPASTAGEIKNLTRQAAEWLNFVRTQRGAVPENQLRELQRLLDE
jgi:hypothetical protein